MGKSRKRWSRREQAQPYDTTFKNWIKERPADIIPVLLPCSIYQETLDIEVTRPAMRVEKVFRVKAGWGGLHRQL